MLSYWDTLVSSAAMFSLVWMFVYFYHLAVYGFGDRKHINLLVDCLAKEPEEFKDKYSLSLSGIGAGGVFTLFILSYPFVRHRRRNRAVSFDLFMWLNWLFFIVAILVYMFG